MKPPTAAKRHATALIAKWAKDHDVLNGEHIPETVWRDLETRVAQAMVEYATERHRANQQLVAKLQDAIPVLREVAAKLRAAAESGGKVIH